MDRLSEIRARCAAVKAEKDKGNLDDCASLAYAVTQVDIPYLLSLLEETWEWDMYQCAKRETERLRGILAEQNARLNQYEAENRWIPVGERLPEDEEGGVLVIVSGKPHENITLDGAYMLATYSRPEGWILDEYPEWECAKITHWRPLPEPPKEGE